MNFAKGKRTKGRGTSFRGALLYYLHDKGATTSKRVGFVEMVNLFGTDPHLAWREMMATVNAAAELKARAGLKASGRKNTQPVYCFALAWHPLQTPDRDHMVATAKDALRVLGIEAHQAVIVQHVDEPHPHVHIMVNMIHPETGRSADLYNDERTLDRWAYQYEKATHFVCSPERAAKHENADPPPRKTDPARPEWEARRASNKSAPAKQRADEIRHMHAEFVKRLKAMQAASNAARQAEIDDLMAKFKRRRETINDWHKERSDIIWKHRRNRTALPFSVQGFRDWRENLAWSALTSALRKERYVFERREHSLSGIFCNVVALNWMTGRKLSGLFNLLADRSERRRLFSMQQAQRTKALRDRQTSSRKIRAANVRKVRDAALAELAGEMDGAMKILKARHAKEVHANKMAWHELGLNQQRQWAAYRQEFGITKRKTEESEGRRSFEFTGSSPVANDDRDKSWKTRKSRESRIAKGTYRKRRRKPI